MHYNYTLYVNRKLKFYLFIIELSKNLYHFESLIPTIFCIFIFISFIFANIDSVLLLLSSFYDVPPKFIFPNAFFSFSFLLIIAIGSVDLSTLG